MPGFRSVDPKQSFPALEQQALARWREQDLFAKQLALREGAETWSFYEGPPTANGKPGSHHVFSRVFKDIYSRYWAMRGYYVPRKGGWDCHGLPVELEVEKQLGISSKAEIEDYGIAEFNAKCRESVFAYVSEWERLTERIGFWVDLDDAYVTMTNAYIESVWWALRQIWDAGRLYEGHKVVPYCPRCGTALSSHEVAVGYHDVVDPSVYVKLPVTEVPPADEIPESPIQRGDNLLVWTTTPWTLISHAAVAAGPEIEYVRATAPASDEVYVLARPLAERVLGEGWVEIASLPGSALQGIRYQAPFTFIKGSDFGEHGHTVLTADFVTTEDGTGLVHTALAFGEDDFQLGESYGMTLQNPVRPDGTYDERVPDFQGKLVFEHNPEIVEALRDSGRLYRAQEYEHSYPHCWRCDTPLIYYAKASWYIRTTEVRDRMLALNERIGWHPEHIKHGRFGKWLSNNVDWALSRERYWGTPLPVWRCEEDGCGEELCAGSIADLREHGGEVGDDLHRPYIDDVTLDCAREGCAGHMRRVPEVIDAWFDSGSMPFAQFHYPFEGTDEFKERFPANYVCEAIDQTRGWFYSLLAVSTLVFDETSYENCVCLGLILDPEGQKMSKSKGNVVDPWEVLDQHGADAFRWYYFTAQQPWAGYRFSADTVGESARQFLIQLWNTYSFWVLYANADGLGPGNAPTAPAPGAGSDLDRWILSDLQRLTQVVTAEMDAYNCTRAGQELAAFVETLSNRYVRLSRRRFWEGDLEAVGTLRHCLVELAKLLAPFVPFVADEIHTNLAPGGGSVHLADFPVAEPVRRDEELEAGVEAAMRAIELGRAARAAAKLKMRQPLAKAVIVATDAERVEIERLGEIVRAELNVKELEFVTEEAELVAYEVKPNYRALGPRFGKSMPQVAAAIAALDGESARAAAKGERRLGINIDGSEHTLEPDDLVTAMKPVAGYEVESESGRAVALALELTDELRREGLAREVVHAVQNARKEAGLEVTDRIALSLGGDEALVDAARAHEEYVAGEVLATSVGYDDAEGASAKIEGRELRIGVARA
ncbi:MAG: isoleucine--tRNA ligase [Actinomycetota bacterium]|nr:isoleucine--tRNA ligase [Actinomycetota bacterium]